MSNRAAGVAVCINLNIFGRGAVTRIKWPPECLTGRAGSVQLDQGLDKIRVNMAYYPPHHSKTSNYNQWKKTAEELTRWVKNEVMVHHRNL